MSSKNTWSLCLIARPFRHTHVGTGIWSTDKICCASGVGLRYWKAEEGPAVSSGWTIHDAWHGSPGTQFQQRLWAAGVWLARRQNEGYYLTPFQALCTTQPSSSLSKAPIIPYIYLFLLYPVSVSCMMTMKSIISQSDVRKKGLPVWLLR